MDHSASSNTPAGLVSYWEDKLMDRQWLTEYKNALAKCKGPLKNSLNEELLVDFLVKVLPATFISWNDPRATFLANLEPISKISYEIDEGGYVYACLYNKAGVCMLSEAHAPDIQAFGIPGSVRKHLNLVAQFLASCFYEALPIVTHSKEFLALPRNKEIVFGVGAHGGWQDDSLLVYNGEFHQPEFIGNPLALQLELDCKYYSSTRPGTRQRAYMDELERMDVVANANFLAPILDEIFHWANMEIDAPLDRMRIAWSSDLVRAPAFGTLCDDKLHIWPGDLSILYQWLPPITDVDLDSEDWTSIRYATCFKFSQIACLAMELVSDGKNFQQLHKENQFTMELRNRAGGAPVLFFK